MAGFRVSPCNSLTARAPVGGIRFEVKTSFGGTCCSVMHVIQRMPDVTQTAMQKIKRFTLNTVGRDFVVGDIHGAFDLVLEAMDRAGFDKQRDRLFSVGDLIDRGPGSHRCARFLAQPYVHAVRGNHEDMLLELYASGEPDPNVLAVAARFNGFEWWLGATETRRAEILSAISQLPLAIEIETERGTVGLIHADVPAGMDWSEFLALIEAGDSDATHTCLWGRDRIRSRDTTGITGVGRVFAGHTPQWDGAVRLGNFYGIDSGAVFGALGALGGEADVRALYSEIGGKRPTRTKFWQEKIRQTLRRYSGHFTPIGEARYRLAVAAPL